MKKYFFITLMLFLVTDFSVAHPLHVAVINITLNGNKLDVKINTFVDDWETAYFHYFGDTISLNSSKNLNSEWFNNYLSQSLQLTINNDSEPLELYRDTVYFNDMSMNLELHASVTGQVKTLYIYNAILTDIFADQTNLLIFSYNGKEKGIKFDYKKKQEELKLR